MARVFACVALALSADGVRTGRRQESAVPEVKHVGGVPILNYNRAYRGQHSLLEDGNELEEDWIVVTKEDASDAAIQELCESSNCRDMGKPEEGGVPFFEVRCSESELEQLVEKADGILSFIEPDMEMYAIETEAEESEAEESADSQAATWGLNKIGADSRVSRGSGTHIYVLDTGVRTTHEQFSGRASSFLDYSSNYRRVCNGASNCAVDRQGHGTHCAGTAGGSTLGVAPQAKIYAAKVLGDDGRGSSSWGIGSLDWIGRNGRKPAVASMSLGGRGASSSYDTAVRSAVGRGVTVVVAAGNENDNACGYSPAFSSSAITVGSTDSTNYKSSFSNYGRCVNIWAPGRGVKSAWWRSNSDTRSISGTSMACPHVSGGAALLLSQFPGNSPSKIRSKLAERSGKNKVRGLRSDDTNHLLWVGAR